MNAVNKIMDHFYVVNDWMTPYQVSEATGVTLEDTKSIIDMEVDDGKLLWSVIEGKYKWNN